MWSIRRVYNLLSSSYLVAARLNSVCYRGAHLSNSIFSFDHTTRKSTSSHSISGSGAQFTFLNFGTLGYCNSTSPVFQPLNVGVSNEDDGFASEEVDDDNETHSVHLAPKNEEFEHEVGIVLGILRSIGCKQSGSESLAENLRLVSCAQVRNMLDDCGVSVTSEELVVDVLSRARNNWEAAYTFFLWAAKQPGYAHSARTCNSMISILAKRRKFDTAWALIDEMRGGRIGSSVVTPDTLMIMIRRYCAVHDVGSAINTFHAFKRFNFHVGKEEFQKFLAALCRYKNVQDAEGLLFSNKDTYPFETKSFNIILNGWSNVIGSPREAKRLWKVMMERGIKLDVVSFSSIISSYSKTNRLKEVLRLYDRMKRMGIAPDRKVYNAVIHALAKGGLVKESLNLLKAMEDSGIPPNVVTYNSLIKPLCRARKRGEAQLVLDEIFRQGLRPTIQTYHAFMRTQRTGEDVLKLLDKMKETGCPPNKDTYIMVIRKLCRWREWDNVFKLWNEMSDNGLNDDCSSYTVLIHGLFLNAKMEEAHKTYLEMKERSIVPDPNIDRLIQTWLSNKQMAESPTIDSEVRFTDSDRGSSGKARFPSGWFHRGRGFQEKLETRKVIKERGFSFWKQ
ncbi:hypothetical protein Dimus_012314 [Dionaea muscipula]